MSEAVDDACTAMDRAIKTIATLRAERDRLREELAEAIRRGEDQWTGWIKAESRTRAAEAERDAARAEVERLTERCAKLLEMVDWLNDEANEYLCEHGTALDPNDRDFIAEVRAALPTPTPARDDPQG